MGASFSGRHRWRLQRAGIDHAEVRRNAGVENRNLLLVDQAEELLCLLIGDDELDFDGKRAREFDEPGFAQFVMAPKPCHRLECRAAVDTALIGLNQQPFPEQPALMALPLVYVKPQERALHSDSLGNFHRGECQPLSSPMLARNRRLRKSHALVRKSYELAEARYARHPPCAVMSMAPSVPWDSHTNPVTVSPPWSSTFPNPSGAGMPSTNEPRSADLRVQISISIEPPPVESRMRPGRAGAPGNANSR